MADELLQLGWLSDLVQQMPREKHQPLLAELHLALRHAYDAPRPATSRCSWMQMCQVARATTF